ncbi:MFS transporter, partial [Buchnera aphidicola (Hormaphis cornu)]
MVYPVLSVFGESLQDSTQFLVGLSIGIYSFFQVLFQVPFGFLSDKIGCKKVIILGLLLFLLGSIIATINNSIWGIILGRMLQGSGSISTALMAFLHNSISNKSYSIGIFCIGITFGITLVVSLIISPIIVVRIGLKGLFGIVSFLTLVSIIIVVFCITESKKYYTRKLEKPSFFNKLYLILSNFKLVEMFYSIFTINYILMSN